MKGAEESKEQLRNKLGELRHRISELEAEILKQRQTEEELLLFKAVVESSAEAIAISDPNGQLVYINPAHEKLFGYSLERARQLNYRDYYPPESIEILDRVVAPALARGESWEGGLDVYDANGRLFPLWERADTVRDEEGKMLYGFGLMHDITESKRVEKELRRRDTILEALATATKRVLEVTSFDEGIQNMLEQLGQATQVSRVYVFENHLSNDGTLLTSQRYEWVAPSITPQIDNPDTQNFPWVAGGMERWVEILNRGETVQGYVKDFPQSEREILSPQGIKSIVVVPIFIDKGWWGFVGFDECLTEREWSVAETEALKASAGTLGGFIQRKRVEEALRRAHDELQARVEERTAKLMEANEQLRKQITEHKRAEMELRESEERFRKAFDYAALGMVLVSPRGRFLKVNSYFCQMVGYTEEELLNRTFNDVTHPDDYHIGLHVLNQVADGIVPYAWVEKRYLHKDGRIVWGMLSTSAVRDAMDNVVYLVSHIQDITERRQAEEALRESEQRYSSLFKNNHSVMLLIDPESADIVDANPAACSFYGWSLKELTSKKITDINMFTNKQVFQEMERARSAQRQHFYFRHRLANEEVRDVEVYSGPIMLHGKQLLYSIIHDISKRKQAEEELRRAHERLEQRTAELVKLNDTLKQEIEERKQVEQKLRKREAELKIQTSELEEVNTALRVLLRRRDEDKTDLEEKVLTNVKELVLPYVERLRKAELTSQCAAYVNVLESNLNDIISPFALKLSSKLVGLTPTEIQVANLIKEGKTTKDIAVMLNLSPRTVEFHRNNIRKKMGIKNKKANLRSHLQSM